MLKIKTKSTDFRDFRRIWPSADNADSYSCQTRTNLRHAFLSNMLPIVQFKHLFQSVPGDIYYGRVQCLFLVSFLVCRLVELSVKVRLLRFRSNSITQRSTQKYAEYHTHDPDMLPIAASNSISRARLLADTGFGGNRPPVS